MSETRDDEREELTRISDLDARQDAYRNDREAWEVHYDRATEETVDAFFRGWDAAFAHFAQFTSNELRLLGAAFDTLVESGWSLSKDERALVGKIKALRVPVGEGEQ